MSLVVPDFDNYPIDHMPRSVSVSDGTLSVIWDDNRVSTYPFIWLREYSPDSGTFNEMTREQNLSIVELPADLSISEAGINPDGSVQVNWQPEQLASCYHPGWLRAHCPQNPQPQFSLPDRIHWTANDADMLPGFSGSKISDLSDTAEFGAWLSALHVYGVGLIRHLDVTPDALESVVERIGPIRTSNFGRIFDVKLLNDTNSNAYTSQPLSAHTDLATREYQPGLQFFFCMENTVSGGTTILSDGFAIAEKIRRDHPEEYTFLVEEPVPFVNKDQDSEYRYEVPVLESDRNGNITAVRFTYWLRAPMTGDIQRLERFYKAMALFHRYADQDKFQIRFQLRPGDLLGIDNRRILHGRSGFEGDSGNRWLRGCYMEREEVESRLRVLDRLKRKRHKSEP